MKLEASYIEGTRGSLFALHYPPVAVASLSECYIVLAPFAEEMNRCRYMQTLLAQSLAERGYGVLIVDPYGTGDSEGDFVDADWQQWREDTLAADTYARELGYLTTSILAIRLGSLLAASVACELKSLHRLILWQPVTSGKVALNQFLRLKIAASISRGEEAETTANLEDQLKNGHSIQVSGYDVSPALFEGIRGTQLDQLPHLQNTLVSWFTVLASNERKTPRADIKTIEKLRETGFDVNHRTVIGPAFWQAHERTLTPDLISATLEYIFGTAP